MADSGEITMPDAQSHSTANIDDWVIVKIEDDNSLTDMRPRIINISTGHRDMAEEENGRSENILDSSGKNSSACSKCDEEGIDDASHSDQESKNRETSGDEEAKEDNESDGSEETGESFSSGDERYDSESDSNSIDNNNKVEYEDEDNGGCGDGLEPELLEEGEEGNVEKDEEERDGGRCANAFYDECPDSCAHYSAGQRRSERVKLDGAPSCGSDTSDSEKDEDDDDSFDSANEDDNHYLQMAILNSLAQTRNMPLQAQRFARLARLRGETLNDLKDASKCSGIDIDNQQSSTSTSVRISNTSKRNRIVDGSHQDQSKSNDKQIQILLSREARLSDNVLTQPLERGHRSVDGEKLEVHCDEEVSENRAKSPFTSGSPSPLCSTRVEFTPAVTRTDFTPASIPVGGALTRCSGGVSAESGRGNPQAKQDREVRQRDASGQLLRDIVDRQTRQVFTSDGKRRRSAGQVHVVCNNSTEVTSSAPNNPARDLRALVLEQQTIRRIHPVLPSSGQYNKAGTRDRTGNSPLGNKPTHNVYLGQESTPAKKQISSSAKVSGPQKVKPRVPVHMRSTASYRDGKIDVSILGDQSIFGAEDPVNVQITFVHRQELPKPKKAEPSNDGEAQRNMHLNGPVFNTPKVIPPIKPIQNLASKAAIYGSVRSHDIKQPIKKAELSQHKVIPPIKTQKKVKNPKKNLNKEKHLKASNFGGKSNRKRFRVKYSPPNFDVINYRSQWPPFNTSTNPETCRIYRSMIVGFPHFL